MKTMYKVNFGFYFDIKEVNVIKETEHTVWLSKNNRYRKVTNDYKYVDTAEEALEVLKKEIERLENKLLEHIKYEEERLDRRKDMYSEYKVKFALKED